MAPRPVTFPVAPPDRIDLPGGLVLQRASTERTAAVVTSVNTSLDHLSPWMEWAAEPATEASIGTFLAAAEELFEQRRDFGYSIVDSATGAVVGGCGLHGRLGRAGLEIGYWVHGDHIGHGVATEAARALTSAAFAIEGIERVEIHCHEDNVRSARVPERLGFTYEGLVVGEEGALAGRPTQVWVVGRAAWVDSPAVPTS